MDDVVRPPSAEYRGARLRQAVIKKFDWTDERTEKLRTLFATGFSARWIAAELDPSGELTRNAVIGKLTRLKLFRGTNKHAPRRPQTSDHQSGSREDVVPRKRSRPNKASQPRHNRGPVSPERLLQLEALQLRDLAPETSPHAVSLIDAKDDQCRWPLGDPGPEFRFCGDNVRLDCSYCERHAQRAFTYSRGPRPHIRKYLSSFSGLTQREIAQGVGTGNDTTDEAVGRL